MGGQQLGTWDMPLGVCAEKGHFRIKIGILESRKPLRGQHSLGAPWMEQSVILSPSLRAPCAAPRTPSREGGRKSCWRQGADELGLPRGDVAHGPLFLGDSLFFQTSHS